MFHESVALSAKGPPAHLTDPGFCSMQLGFRYDYVIVNVGDNIKSRLRCNAWAFMGQGVNHYDRLAFHDRGIVKVSATSHRKYQDHDLHANNLTTMDGVVK